MTGPVITADRTACADLVIRWRRHPEGPVILSASRRAVLVHGSVTVDDTVRQWMVDAGLAHAALRAGRDGEAAAMATGEEPPAASGDPGYWVVLLALVIFVLFLIFTAGVAAIIHFAIIHFA